MIPLAEPNLAGNEERYLRECVHSNFVSSVGPFVDRFEEMVAQACGAHAAVATTSGTAALHVALTAAGVGRGDMVIVPSYTFIGSANAVSQCGAIPWLMDVSEESWTLDPEQLEEMLRKHTRRSGHRLVHISTGRRVAAIMPVYVFGQPADMLAIGGLARDNGVPVVADAAAALGAEYRGCGLGDLADLTVFSFNGNKTLTAGGGGAVVSNVEPLLHRVRHLSTTARVGGDYIHDEVGFNYRMTNLQAAVGCAQMERLDELVQRKREIRRRYDEAFATLEAVGQFPDPPWGRSACWLSGLTLERGQSLPGIRSALRESGLESRSFWKPLHQQPAYVKAPRASDLGVSEMLARKILVLPSSTSLSRRDQNRVISAVRREIPAFTRRRRPSA